MRISPEKLSAEAEETGFRADVLEKAVQLLGVLDVLRNHPFLKNKLVLKGGTALNLFVFDVPRLSVDIDLNYVGAQSLDAMLKERPKIESAVQAVFRREDFAVRRMPKNTPEESGSCTIQLRLGKEADSKWMLILCTACPCGPLLLLIPIHWEVGASRISPWWIFMNSRQENSRPYWQAEGKRNQVSSWSG